MKKILSLLIFGFLICSNFNTSLIIQQAFAEDNAAVKSEIQQEIPETSFQADDVLDKPVFEEKQQSTNKVNKVTSKISSFVVKGLGLILLAFVAIICLLFIVIANKQHKAEKKRKRMSANANVVNAVDNFARHRIKE